MSLADIRKVISEIDDLARVIDGACEGLFHETPVADGLRDALQGIRRERRRWLMALHREESRELHRRRHCNQCHAAGRCPAGTADAREITA